jgi:hypothetical protein
MPSNDCTAPGDPEVHETSGTVWRARSRPTPLPHREQLVIDAQTGADLDADMAGTVLSAVASAADSGYSSSKDNADRLAAKRAGMHAGIGPADRQLSYLFGADDPPPVVEGRRMDSNGRHRPLPPLS